MGGGVLNILKYVIIVYKIYYMDISKISIS